MSCGDQGDKIDIYFPGSKYNVSPLLDCLPTLTSAPGFLMSMMILNKVATELSCVFALHNAAVGRLSSSVSKPCIP